MEMNSGSSRGKRNFRGRVSSGDARLLEDMATENRKIITQIWELSDGSRMRVSVTVDGDPKRLTSDGQLSPRFEYQFRYHDRSSERYPGMTSYDMRAGLHRIDWIPEGKYVLLETRVPDGYQGVEPILITVDRRENIVRCEVENRREPEEKIACGRIRIRKTDAEDKELKLSGHGLRRSAYRREKRRYL